MLRAHLKAQSKTALSSFYIFDALARNAHDQSKQAAKGRRGSPELAENASAWLRNSEGIVEEMISSTLKRVPAAYQVGARSRFPDPSLGWS